MTTGTPQSPSLFQGKQPATEPDPASTSPKPLHLPHIHALDGARGLAALAIVAHHTLYGNFPYQTWPIPAQLLFAVAYFSSLGINFFFVLSGYLITTLLLLARRRPSYFHDFYAKRALRILPPLVLILAVDHLVFHLPRATLISALLFVANWNVLFHLPDVGPYWTISIEEQFYLAWPFLLRRLHPRSLVRVLVTIIATSVLARVTATLTGHGNFRYTPMQCDDLAWGALLAVFALRRRIPFSPNRQAAPLWRRWGRPLVLFGLLLTPAAIWLSLRRLPELGLGITATAPLFTGLLAYLLTHPHAALSRLLATRPLVFLGRISYMLYLSHVLVLTLIDRLTRNALTDSLPHIYLRFLLVVTLDVIFCTLSLYLFEQPVARLRPLFVRSSR